MNCACWDSVGHRACRCTVRSEGSSLGFCVVHTPMCAAGVRASGCSLGSCWGKCGLAAALCSGACGRRIQTLPRVGDLLPCVSPCVCCSRGGPFFRPESADFSSFKLKLLTQPLPLALLVTVISEHPLTLCTTGLWASANPPPLGVESLLRNHAALHRWGLTREVCVQE